jgi:hypothetical protein
VSGAEVGQAAVSGDARAAQHHHARRAPQQVEHVIEGG